MALLFPKSISAQINGNATFSPPRKVVTFNANIKNNDGLLTNYIASVEKTNYEIATNKIKQTVASWVAKIENNESVSFPKIGTIVANGSENKWFFSPENSTNFLTSSFGFNQIVSPEITREVLKQEVEELEEKVPVIFTPERKKNKFTFLKYAAVFAVLGTVGLFGYKQYHDQKVEEQTLLVQKNVQEKVQQQLQEATFFIETPSISIELPVVEEKLPYHLIAGAFRNEANAQKSVQNLIQKGYKAHILNKNKSGLFPVAFGSFKTKQEADLEQQKLLKEGNQTWLLIE